MPVVSSRLEQKYIRMSKWLDRIIKNIEYIQHSISFVDPDHVDYTFLRKQIMEQYRLIMLLKNVQENKTQLNGADMIKPKYFN